MPIANLYGIGPRPPGAAEEPASDGGVAELLASLEQPNIPEPPRPGKGQMMLGSIGDALTAAAAVRAGGAPPQMGAYAARQAQQQRDFQVATQQAAAAGRDLRNRIRIGEYGKKQDQETWEKRRKIINEEANKNREVEAQAKYRQSLIDKIQELQIDTGGKSVASMSDEDLEALVAGHDPWAAALAKEQVLPDHLEVKGYRQLASGAVVPNVGPKSDDGLFRPGVTMATMLAWIEGGGDPRPLFNNPNSPAAQEAYKMFLGIAGNAKAKQADQMLADIAMVAGNMNTRVGEMTAGAAEALAGMGVGKPNNRQVRDYYFARVDQVADMIKNPPPDTPPLTQIEAEEALTAIRYMISIRFPDALSAEQTAWADIRARQVDAAPLPPIVPEPAGPPGQGIAESLSAAGGKL